MIGGGDRSPLELDLEDKPQAIEPVELVQHAGRTVLRYDFQVGLVTHAGRARYRLDGVEHAIEVPAIGQAPSYAYGSCNGFSSLKLMKSVRDKNAMWKRISELHAAEPVHLLLLGGDQVYADSMWTRCPLLSRWNELSWGDGNAEAFTDAMRDELEAFYFELYCSRWSQPEVATILARLPMVAMWDDHDVMDGWGSYPPARQECPVFQGIGAVARRNFKLFQLQLADDEAHPAAIGDQFTLAFRVADHALLALDMRSQRTVTRVLSSEHWDTVFDWMHGLSAEECRHLFIMSSIPVIYPGFDLLERLLGWMPGQQELEDDLRDHWNSRAHKVERIRFLHHLIDLGERGIRASILSGDVHVGAIGHLETQLSKGSRDPALVYQLISSGIVHPGPNGTVLFALRHLFDNVDEVEPGIVTRMTEFPGTSVRFIGRRNFLVIRPDQAGGRDKGRIWVSWIVEHDPDRADARDDTPYTKVIYPLPAKEST